jgi:hypothetical protein
MLEERCLSSSQVLFFNAWGEMTSLVEPESECITVPDPVPDPVPEPALDPDPT